MAKKTKAKKASKPKRAKEKRDFSQIALRVAEQATGSKPLSRKCG